MFVIATVTAPAATLELLLADIFDLGASGVEEKDGQLLCFFENTTIGDVKPLFADFSADAKIEFTEQEEENWMENWKENFKPVFLGADFVIKPTWETVETNRITIDIDPKMAFGTGTHETTQLILEYLKPYVLPNCNLLDVGTGSGILGIAAEKLGAADVLGIDIDPEAIENALENIALNSCTKSMMKTGVITDVSGKYDTVLANINRHILLDIKEELQARVKKGGFLLLSGLLDVDRADIKKRYSDLELIDEKIKGEWALLVFKN